MNTDEMTGVIAGAKTEIENLRRDKDWLRKDIAELSQALADSRKAQVAAEEEAWEYRYLLKDVLDCEAEMEAIGGGPGFKERRAKAYAAAWERFSG